MKPKPPAIGSRWKFRGLEEPTLFEVVLANGSSVRYRTVGVAEADTIRTLADFLANFEPA